MSNEYINKEPIHPPPNKLRRGLLGCQVKQFRKNVRRQNICVRHGFLFYSKDFERKRVKEEIMRVTKHKEMKEKKIKYLQQIKVDYWFPDEITYPEQV